MQQIPLVAQKRTILGRKVKALRREGLIPAHVFGHKIKTEHIQVKTQEFMKVYDQAGETGIIDLAVDSPPSRAGEAGQKKPVLVRNVQIHPVTDELLHIDFYQVNLAEKVKVNVPIEIVGEALAVAKKTGLLLTPVSEVEIEALPADIPENIEVDVSKLENIGDEIRVKDLKVERSKIDIQTDEELIVASIGELVTKEMEAVEAEIEAEQAEAAAAEVPVEAAEGAAEGETPAAPAEAAAEGAEPVKGEEKAQEQPKPEESAKPKEEQTKGDK